jgi:hypothetical protein
LAGVSSIDYQVRPLRSYKDFDWYDPETEASGITLVVCDGPPATSRGGRYGLMPLFASRLAPNARVFLDDYERPSEQQVVDRWSEEFGWSVEQVYTSDKGQFCNLTKSVRSGP